MVGGVSGSVLFGSIGILDSIIGMIIGQMFLGLLVGIVLGVGIS